MAWSPFQRANAGIIWVEQPGDYANPIPTTAATGPSMLPLASQRSLPVVKGNGFFQADFSAAVGEFNNTKSVGFTLEGDRTREVYRFLKRTVPIKRLDFLAVAQENGLIRHQTPFRSCMRVSG
jgi:hypothetical protein